MFLVIIIIIIVIIIIIIIIMCIVKINNIVSSGVHLFIYISIISRYLRSEKTKNGNHYVETSSVSPWPSISVCRIFMKFEMQFLYNKFRENPCSDVHNLFKGVNEYLCVTYILLDRHA